MAVVSPVSSACRRPARGLFRLFLLGLPLALAAAACGDRAAVPRAEKLLHLTDFAPAAASAGAAKVLPAFPAGAATPDAAWEAPADFPAATVGRLRLAAQGTARLATLTWRLAQDPGFSRFRALSFPLAGDGRPHTYEVDLQREAHWHGEVRGLRIGVDGGELRLDRIAVEAPDDPYRAMSLGGETMPALYGGNRIELRLPADLPAGTLFEAHVGLIPEYDKPGVAARFRVSLSGRDGLHPWLAETVVGGRATGPGWRAVRYVLTAPAERGQTLVLETAAAPPSPAAGAAATPSAAVAAVALPEGAAVWGNPLLIRPGRPSGRNLVVILIDTLRADAVGAYGDRSGLTPRLDAFARQGVRFADLQSPAPWTLPSVSSLLTGLQPQTHGAGQRFGDFDPASPRQNDFAPTGLPGGVRTLAGVLRQQGFYSIGVYQNFYILPGFGIHQGFDDYTSFEDRGEVLVDNALARLREAQADRPTFLYLHFFDLHSPYNPPPAECAQVAHRLEPAYAGPVGCDGDRNPERTTVPPPGDRPWFHALYRAELAYTDRQVGRFLDGLRDLGLADDTVVMVVSDHGEEFWDRLGQETALGYETNSDHGHTFYQELVHVPALLRIPGRKPAVVNEPVEMVDLFPTLLHAVGVDPPASQGTDLTALLDGDPATRRPTMLADVLLRGRPRWAVRRGPWKLVVARDPALPTELYDLEHDPGERTNVAAAQPQVVVALRAWGEREIAARLKARGVFLKRGDTLGATYLEWRYITKLRALGYLK